MESTQAITFEEYDVELDKILKNMVRLGRAYQNTNSHADLVQRLPEHKRAIAMRIYKERVMEYADVLKYLCTAPDDVVLDILHNGNTTYLGTQRKTDIAKYIIINGCVQNMHKFAK